MTTCTSGKEPNHSVFESNSLCARVLVSIEFLPLKSLPRVLNTSLIGNSLLLKAPYQQNSDKNSTVVDYFKQKYFCHNFKSKAFFLNNVVNFGL